MYGIFVKNYLKIVIEARFSETVSDSSYAVRHVNEVNECPGKIRNQKQQQQQQQQKQKQ